MTYVYRWKRRTGVVLGWVALGLLLLVRPVSATTIDLQPGQNEVFVNGNSVWLDTAPYVEEGRTMVPLNLIADSFDATVDTFRTDDGLRARIIFNGMKVFLMVGNQGAHFINPLNQDCVYRMDVAPEMVDGQVFVPLRFVAEGLGAQVNWDPDSNSINIQ